MVKQTKIDFMIDSIMEHFDWERVQKVMKFLNWRWAGVPNFGVPQVEDLKRTSLYVIEQAIKGILESKSWKPDEPYICATGGFKASVTKNRYNHVNYINLEFILTDWSSDGD